MSNETQLKMIRSLAYSREWNDKATVPQIRLVNIYLSDYCETRYEKLWLLEYWFSREFTSSKELTKGEACAILDMALTDEFNHDPDFVAFVDSCLREYYQF